MAELECGALARLTPCQAATDSAVANALAEVRAEWVLVHPFREGNGRLAPLLARLMALQAGLPPLDFTPLAGGRQGPLHRRHSCRPEPRGRAVGGDVRQGYRPLAARRFQCAMKSSMLASGVAAAPFGKRRAYTLHGR
jgi:hypothetical protein